MLRIAVFLFLLREYSCFLVLPPSNGTVVLPPSNGTVVLPPSNGTVSRRLLNNGDPPVYFDWRDINMVSPVKNQLNCAACWAFSCIANIESHLKIYRDMEEVLSEQFLIDCDEAKKGCDGNASILVTFAHIVTTFGGVLRDRDYGPYVEERRQCRWKPGHSREPGSLFFYPQPVPVVGFQRVRSNEEVMARFVYQRGPLSAGINSASMAKYTGGIDEPTDEDCCPEKLNHAVLIVGYNVYVSKSGRQVPYWIIKNSWGTAWGDRGFYYLVRGRNACGIASDVSYVYV